MLYIIILLLLLLIGFIQKMSSLQSIRNKLHFLVTYNNNYVDYLNDYFHQPHEDAADELFSYLVRHSQKAQKSLGNIGYVGHRPAFENYIMNNYPVIVNIIPSLRSNRVTDPISSSLTQNKIDDEFLHVNHLLQMGIGSYEEKEDKIKKEIRNPFILLKAGVQFIVTLPISLMYWTGLIKYSTLNRISNYFIIKLLNFLIILIGFFSAIVTLVTGWEPFMKIINQ
ncbi:hypothetical protein COF09_16485 [Bacillus toyonensis]|uniref:hypothetical protein n=1 Tax=Bacillus toyonensis TaxID=155322 RepID=UPI000BFE93AF|nr:hypothetical protein [Bacillus toyonensis]PHC41310.1 hypothetical protein COF09_16485 [Bacillus toyonensis]